MRGYCLGIVCQNSARISVTPIVRRLPRPSRNGRFPMPDQKPIAPQDPEVVG